jgi:hypothetical protein
MAGFRMVTWRYWALVVGVIAPLFPAAIYAYVVTLRVMAGDQTISPLYPVVFLLGMGLPPLLVVGLFMSYVLRRPQAAGPRFLVGLAIGVTLLLIAQTDALKWLTT